MHSYCLSIGAAAGGCNGIYTGLQETKAAQLTGAVKRTQYVTATHNVTHLGLYLLKISPIVFDSLGSLGSNFTQYAMSTLSMANIQ